MKTQIKVVLVKKLKINKMPNYQSKIKRKYKETRKCDPDGRKKKLSLSGPRIADEFKTITGKIYYRNKGKYV